MTHDRRPIRRLTVGLTSVVAAAVFAVVALPRPALAASSLASGRFRFESVLTVSGSATITAGFSAPVKCSSVAVSDFTASVNGATRTIIGAACAGTSDATIDLTLASPLIVHGDVIAVTLVGRVADLAGTRARLGVTRTITVDPLAFISVATAGAGPAAITAVFSKPVKCMGVAAADFSATVNGVARTVTALTCTGVTDDTVELGLSDTLQAGDLVSVSLVGIVRDPTHQVAPVPTTCTAVV